MVLAGEKLRESKKKAKMASATSSSQRDWGKVRPSLPARALPPPLRACSWLPSVSTVQGMACVGRTKECTIVPSNHYGPIPGIPVGTMWRFRVQVPVTPLWGFGAPLVATGPLRWPLAEGHSLVCADVKLLSAPCPEAAVPGQGWHGWTEPVAQPPRVTALPPGHRQHPGPPAPSGAVWAPSPFFSFLVLRIEPRAYTLRSIAAGFIFAPRQALLSCPGWARICLSPASPSRALDDRHASLRGLALVLFLMFRVWGWKLGPLYAGPVQSC